MKEALKHYSHINTGAKTRRHPSKRALENARFFDKNYKEFRGRLGYFNRIISGLYPDKDFFSIGPEEIITQETFLSHLNKS